MRIVLALVFCILSAATVAQTFPSKPMRIVVRAPPGGTDDLLARLISQKMTEVLGQPMVTDYRTGAGGLVAWEYTAKAPPDGYTVLLAASGLGAIRTLRPDATVDPWRDFAWLSQVTNYQLVIVAHPSLPVKSVKELIALARAQPGKLSYGSSGVGATPYFAAEYLKALAKVDILHVPYKGAGPMYVDLLGGRLELAASVVASALPHIQSGRVRAVGVSGAKRVPQLPQVATIGESLPGYEFDAFYALLVPSKTPRDIVMRLNDAIVKVVAAPDYRERVIGAGMEPVSNTPEQMLQVAKIDAAKVEKIVRTAGIKME